MAQPPICRNPACRQPMTFLAEEKGAYIFGCYACGAARVITTPRTQEAAAELARQQQLAVGSHSPIKRTYSFSKG